MSSSTVCEATRIRAGASRGDAGSRAERRQVGAGDSGHHPRRHLLGRVHADRIGGRGRRGGARRRACLQRTIRLRDFPAMLETSARVNGVILPIIAVAMLFAQALTVLDVPQTLVAALTSVDRRTATLLIADHAADLHPRRHVHGDDARTSSSSRPLLAPVAQKIGMDPIHFCVFMITSLGLGFITPPMGLNLFVMSGLTGSADHDDRARGRCRSSRDDRGHARRRLRARAFTVAVAAALTCCGATDGGSS